MQELPELTQASSLLLISWKTTPRPPKPGGFRVPPSAEENVSRCFLPWVAWLLTGTSVPHRLDCVQEAQVFWVSLPARASEHPLTYLITARPGCTAVLGEGRRVCTGGGGLHDFFFYSETGTHYVTLADLRLGWPRIQRSFCLCLPCTEIQGMCHCAQLDMN